jgi:hypothetical protein
VRDVASALGIAKSCLYRWTSRDEVDRGVETLTPAAVQSAALAAAHAWITELENEVKVLRKAAAAVEEVVQDGTRRRPQPATIRRKLATDPTAVSPAQGAAHRALRLSDRGTPPRELWTGELVGVDGELNPTVSEGVAR